MDALINYTIILLNFRHWHSYTKDPIRGLSRSTALKLVYLLIIYIIYDFQLTMGDNKEMYLFFPNLAMP